MMSEKGSDILFAGGTAIILWASAFAGIRAGLTAYSPLHLAFLRMLIGSLGLAGFALLTGLRLPDFRDIPIILLAGFSGFTVYHLALNIGEVTVSAGPSSLIVASSPVFTALLATFRHRERLSARGWLGTAVCFAGVALVALGTDGTFHWRSGILWILLAAFSESFYFVIQRPYLQKYGTIAFTTYTIWAGTLFMACGAPGVTADIQSASLAANLSVLYLGIFPTAVAYLAFAYATLRAGSTKSSASIYLTPVIAALIAWFWLGEVPDGRSMIGGVVVMIGVLLVGRGVTVNRKFRNSSIPKKMR
ncbi:MAG: DMT family transporter [Sporolactobacillus sp.]|jgi:drug/metabolite transporter (DMT)-like permease|nr:DMT family transporter [Sporolactobacillus sp.]